MMKDEQGRIKLPPILLFRDDNGILRLVDGYHRTMAAHRCQFETIRAIIRNGTKAEAIWEAARVNSQNGVPLRRCDFRKAVSMLSESYPDRSNNMIAEVLSCTEGTVRYHLNQVRKITNLPEGNSAENHKVIGRDGKQYPAKRRHKTIPKTSNNSQPEDVKEVTDSSDTEININNESISSSNQPVTNHDVEKHSSPQPNPIIPEDWMHNLFARFPDHLSQYLPVIFLDSLLQEMNKKHNTESVIHQLIGYLIHKLSDEGKRDFLITMVSRALKDQSIEVRQTIKAVLDE
jgi:hypothetical protein